MILDRRERAARTAGLGLPSRRMVKVQRGAMIDQPQLAVPHQHVRVPDGPVDVGDTGVEPDDARGEIRRKLLHDRIVGDRSRQEVERQIAPGAIVDERMDLGIGLGPRQVHIEVREHDLRHLQSERARNLPRHQLRDQRPRPLPRAAELQDIQPVVVGFDDGGKRAAFAQRRDVAGDVDRPEAGTVAIVARRGSIVRTRSRGSRDGSRSSRDADHADLRITFNRPISGSTRSDRDHVDASSNSENTSPPRDRQSVSRNPCDPRPVNVIGPLIRPRDPRPVNDPWIPRSASRETVILEIRVP